MSRPRSGLALALALVAPFAACVGSPQAQKPAQSHQPPERDVLPKPYDGPLNGKEQVAWLQPVGAGTRISEFTFYIYIDGTKQPLPHTECSFIHGSRHQLCKAPLPEMSPGKHTLRFAAVRVVEGKEKTSSLSEPLVVTRGLERGGF